MIPQKDGTHFRGQTFLVAEHGAIEHAPDGKLWHPKGRLPEPGDDADGWPLRVCLLIWLVLLLPLWAGIIALVLWALR